VELHNPAAGAFLTPSGRIEILNVHETEPLPRYMPTHEEVGGYPLRLMTAPSPFSLNASFYEQEELRHQQRGMRLMMNPADALTRGIADGERVVTWNDLGEVIFILDVTLKVPAGLVVAEGIWWLEFAPGSRSVNALTSQRLTDRGGGSTFCDNRVEVRGSN
jgi:anaerobic selenocysteine-containing dehydrogenase